MKLAVPTQAPPSGRGLAYRETRTGTILYVESDLRHVAAISPAGKLLWVRDPFEEAHIDPYRFERPLITHLGDGGDWCGTVGKACAAVTYDSSQFGVLEVETGEFHFLGQD